MAPDDSPVHTVPPGRATQAAGGHLMRPAATTVEPRAHLAAAAYLMKRSGGSALVVVTDDDTHRPVAVVTDADISQAVADGKDLGDTRITDLHVGPPMTVQPGTPVPEVARLMLSTGLEHLPVTDGDRLVGMVDMPDVCRALLDTQDGRIPA
jgi:CBS domain-containing protein